MNIVQNPLSLKKIVRSVAATGMAAVVAMAVNVGSAEAAGDAHAPKAMDWSFNGLFGTYDRAALQRGYQVYKEVCAACHSMKYMRFRNLGQEGGPEFSEAEVKALAAQYTIEDGPDEFGDMFDRPRLPKDPFPSPFANEEAARASNGGALPPDLSLITKARANGPNYVYSLLTGYEEAPADFTMNPGMHYNPYFAGGQIGMAPPLFEEMVEYADGTPATVEQMSKDVVTFLMWAAEPKLEQRHSAGFQVLVFLTIFAGLLYFSMRRVWADAH